MSHIQGGYLPVLFIFSTLPCFPLMWIAPCSPCSATGDIYVHKLFLCTSPFTLSLVSNVYPPFSSFSSYGSIRYSMEIPCFRRTRNSASAASFILPAFFFSATCFFAAAFLSTSTTTADSATFLSAALLLILSASRIA